MADLSLQVVSFLGTYAIHSTVLLVGVLLVLRLRSRRSGEDPIAELSLRAAMVGGVATAPLHRLAGLPVVPGIRWSAATENPVTAAEASQPAMVGADPNRWSTLAEPSAATSAGTPWSSHFHELWSSPALLWGYAAVAALLLGCRAWASLRFATFVANRRPVTDARSLAMLDELVRAAGLDRTVRLSECPGLQSPVAFGWERPEVCLPPRVGEAMDGETQRCVLAHEVAHLRGADPRWSLVYDLMVALFFFQPLLAVARRRLRDLAEYRCDAWAVDRSGDRVVMAKTLIQVAEWLSGRQTGSAVSVAMAHSRSPLARRVERILDPGAPPTPVSRLGRLAVCGVVVVGGVGLPGIEPAPVPVPSSVVDRVDASGGVQSQLIRLEREIAALHSGLAETWRLLEGRDRPQVVATLEQMQRRLEQITAERANLWREATVGRSR